MPLMHVGQTRKGHSLPGELRARQFRGTEGFAQARLAHGMSGFALGDVCDPEADDYNPVACTLESPAGQSPAPYNPGAFPNTSIPNETTYAPGGYTIGFDPSIVTAQLPSNVVASPPGWNGPSVVAPNATPPAAPAGYEWVKLMSVAGQDLARILAVSQGQGVQTLANGSQLIYPVGSSGAVVGGNLNATTTGALSLGGLSLPVLALGAVVLWMFVGRGRNQ